MSSSAPASSSSPSTASAASSSLSSGASSSSSLEVVAAAAAAAAKKKSPSDFLQTVLGQRVVVRLSNGTDYKGILTCLDDRMNIALSQTEEYLEGSLTNSYGLALIRGNNVLYISSADGGRED
ncbi:u6 snrna-associated sm family protein lsm6 [Cystoisospora suis]|uniref:U6 snrna-associated sm family protein lsm6 n=1 Tax=Cystoisospora suis TaxID=483139 RepID=A0A2C6KV26_9APIC|nr:u6 snrna-associated sm family protein lsm6 [Cystoisospora suis]